MTQAAPTSAKVTAAHAAAGVPFWTSSSPRTKAADSSPNAGHGPNRSPVCFQRQGGPASKLCFLEIGPKDSTADDALKKRVNDAVANANRLTDQDFPPRSKSPRTYVYGSYVDEPLAMSVGTGASAKTYYFHANHLYSVAALTDATGAVVERYSYDAMGRRTITAADGITVRSASSYGNQIGFTGRYHDDETGLQYFRSRMYSASLGRFISRDSAGYVNGMGLYRAYYVPNGVDPTGQYNEAGHYYTVWFVARAYGVKDEEAIELAAWAQYPDVDPQYNAMGDGGLGDMFGALFRMRNEVQENFHVLNGADPVKNREVLNCLFAKKDLDPDVKAVLLHTYGDTFSHSRPGYKTVGYGKQMSSVPTGQLVQYSHGLGHGADGHLPDYIGDNPAKYAEYVDSLAGAETVYDG